MRRKKLKIVILMISLLMTMRMRSQRVKVKVVRHQQIRRDLRRSQHQRARRIKGWIN